MMAVRTVSSVCLSYMYIVPYCSKETKRDSDSDSDSDSDNDSDSDSDNDSDSDSDSDDNMLRLKS